MGRYANGPSSGVYFVLAIGTNRVKIGYTRDCDRRLNELKTSCPFGIVVLGWKSGGPEIERVLHKRFKKYRRYREWFEVSDSILGYIGSECDFFVRYHPEADPEVNQIALRCYEERWGVPCG